MNKQYICKIEFKDERYNPVTELTNYKPEIVRDPVSGELFFGNINGFFRLNDIHHIHVTHNPQYDPKAD
jgi:hypothetical protein